MQIAFIDSWLSFSGRFSNLHLPFDIQAKVWGYVYNWLNCEKLSWTVFRSWYDKSFRKAVYFYTR